MTSTLYTAGRLGNHVIRNLAVSLVAKKFNLHVNYSYYELMKSLGIELFIGEKYHNNSQLLNDSNYLHTLQSSDLNNNLIVDGFFQTTEICNILYNYIRSDEISTNIINNNEFKDRYNTNNDLFIHIRLGDATRFNPGVNYYINTINHVQFDNLYISTDDKDHNIVTTLLQMYPDANLIQFDEKTTFQFASTCKNIILSHGSFSAVIGYLSFFSNVYYPEYEHDKIWYGDMFSIDGWNKMRV